MNPRRQQHFFFAHGFPSFLLSLVLLLSFKPIVTAGVNRKRGIHHSPTLLLLFLPICVCVKRISDHSLKKRRKGREPLFFTDTEIRSSVTSSSICFSLFLSLFKKANNEMQPTTIKGESLAKSRQQDQTAFCSKRISFSFSSSSLLETQVIVTDDLFTCLILKSL